MRLLSDGPGGEAEGRGDEEGESRRRGSGDDRVGRRPIEDGGGGGSSTINLLNPLKCGVQSAPRCRNALLALKSPSDDFYIEAWGNARIYYVLDDIYYFFRTNERAFVTLFWIGPEGSVFIPFQNLELSPNKNHKIDPNNIIVEPVGLERWRVLATQTPHSLPCTGDADTFLSALRAIQRSGPYAVGRWDVTSKSGRRR